MEIRNQAVDRDRVAVALVGVEILPEITGGVDFEPGPVLLLDARTVVITDTANVRAHFARQDENGIWTPRTIVDYGSGPNELTRIDYVHRENFGFVVGGGAAEVVFDSGGNHLRKRSTDYPAGSFCLVDELLVLHPYWTDYDSGEISLDHLVVAFRWIGDEWRPVAELVSLHELKRPPGTDQRFLAFGGALTCANGRVWFAPRFENSLFTATLSLGVAAPMLYRFDDQLFNRFDDAGRDDWVLVNLSLEALADGTVLIGRGPTHDGSFVVDRFADDGSLIAELHIDVMPRFISAINGNVLVADGWRENRIVLYEIPAPSQQAP